MGYVVICCLLLHENKRIERSHNSIEEKKYFTCQPTSRLGKRIMKRGSFYNSIIFFLKYKYILHIFSSHMTHIRRDPGVKVPLFAIHRKLLVVLMRKQQTVEGRKCMIHVYSQFPDCNCLTRWPNSYKLHVHCISILSARACVCVWRGGGRGSIVIEKQF